MPTSSYDATAIHKKGAQRMEGPLTVAGVASYVEFPDGSKQYVAAGGTSDQTGFITVTNVAAQGGGAISSKVFADAPNNTLLTSCTSSTVDITVSVRSSHPNVTVNGTAAILTLTGGVYVGSVNTTVAGAGAIPVAVTGKDVTSSFTLALDSPPAILTLAFTGGYPGSQTELKAGDTFQITGTTDKAATAVYVENSGAGIGQELAMAGTNFTVTMTIADRGTTVQSLAALVKAKNAAGAYGADVSTNAGGGGVDGVNLVKCNNRYPTVTFGAITYPVGQGALKDSETADVAVTTADLNTIAYTSPNGDLSITNPGTDETPKVVTRIAGNYNVSTTNLRAVATRTANNAVTTTNGVVKIAHVACAISVTEPYARLRSGGNNGTSAQTYTITIGSDQVLYEAPTMSKSEAETEWVEGSWTWGGGASATRTLRVHDDDTKGTFNWTSLSAKNLAGKVTTTITGDAQYVLGGFVARDLTFAAYSQSTTLNTGVVTYTKLITNTAGCYWSSKGTSNLALRNATQGNHSDLIDTYTVDSIANVGPINLWWCDVAAAGANSGGTAKLIQVEELV